jgi:hypothetical protein
MDADALRELSRRLDCYRKSTDLVQQNWRRPPLGPRTPCGRSSDRKPNRYGSDDNEVGRGHIQRDHRFQLRQSRG